MKKLSVMLLSAAIFALTEINAFCFVINNQHSSKDGVNGIIIGYGDICGLPIWREEFIMPYGSTKVVNIPDEVTRLDFFAQPVDYSYRLDCCNERKKRMMFIK